jgi:hypothetical protein
MCAASTGPSLPRSSTVTRRTFLGGVGAAAGSVLLPLGSVRPALSAVSFTGSAPITAAMHVHASWSEGRGSWEAQFAQARALGCNLIFLTDHDFRAVAWNYLTSMNGVPYQITSTGSFRQRQVTPNGAALRLLAESATTTRASVSAAVQETPTAWNRLRTSIAGTVLRHTMGGNRLTNGATYEVVVLLSFHPATGGRPAGQYALRYRYGSAPPNRHLEGAGLTGVVQRGPTAPGTVHDFDLVADVQRFWPDLLAIDNGLMMLSFVASSPRSGAVADVVRNSLNILRTGHTEADVISQQRAVIDRYAPRFPGLRMRPSVEISRLDPHLIPFGVPQFFPNQGALTWTNRDGWYRQLSADVHSRGGLLSWNHAFGATAGPLLSAAAQATLRRSVFADMLAKGWYGADILEVGYTVRGQVSTQSHFDLWDTFSRRGIFLTGNGTNDDHAGEHWATLNNGWTTGMWAPTSADADTTPALRAGRVYTRHAGRWTNGSIDLLVDDTVQMGKASVRNVGTSRSVAVFANNLPAGSTVEFVRGPVDGTGSDPATAIASRVTAAAFTGSGIVARPIDTTSSCFVRAQVRDATGMLVGTSNPVWLLRTTPARGIPPARRG